jgi:hypothetical protein
MRGHDRNRIAGRKAAIQRFVELLLNFLALTRVVLLNVAHVLATHAQVVTPRLICGARERSLTPSPPDSLGSPRYPILIKNNSPFFPIWR